MSKGRLFFVILAVWATSLPGPTFAQAWLAPAGEASFSLTYQNLYTRQHFFSDGHREDQGHVRSNILLADLGYSVTDRLAVRVNLPYVASKYTGQNAHQFPVDDGSLQDTFQDFRLEARYNAVRGPLVITPFVAGIVPSHHYEYFGHAVAGTDLKQFLVGSSVGRRLDPILPEAFIQARYSYAFVEKVDGISHNRSNLDVQLGYLVKPSFQVYVLGMGQLTHGGLPLDKKVVKAKWTAADFHHHVQATRSDLLGLGGGADLQVTGSLDLFGAFMTTLVGRSDHVINAGITLGISLSFSPRQVIRRISQPAAPAAAFGL